MILVGICFVLSAGAFHLAYSQASTPTDNKPKPQEPASNAPSMPQGPPNQKAVQKSTGNKPAATGQTGTPGTTQTDKAALHKNLGASLIVSNIGPGCIPCCVNLKNPDCVVEDVTQLPD